MKPEDRHFSVDLAVIGSGLAGFAASSFALSRGISTAQVGNTGALAYTTGYLDLYGSHQSARNDPWAGLAGLRDSQPSHPLARIGAADIRSAFAEFTDVLAQGGIGYTDPGAANSFALTPVGTTKPTYCLPMTMAAGVRALDRRSPCLIVDFHGLRGFSARQVWANLHHRWPALRWQRLAFPELTGEIYPEVMARALEVPAHRRALADLIRPIIGDAEYLGLPAVLGVHNPDLVMADLSRMLGLPVFEIPTMPPAVPGIRLREMFEQQLPRRGLTLVPQQKVAAVDLSPPLVRLSLADNFGAIGISAKAVILATGRFLGGGLEARIDGIVEPLLGLPVRQPPSRDQWYGEQYLHPAGHAIHLSGVDVDACWRPLAGNGQAHDRRLFAAGSIIAGQDWMCDRCGAGVAIATAHQAVSQVRRLLQDDV